MTKDEPFDQTMRSGLDALAKKLADPDRNGLFPLAGILGTTPSTLKRALLEFALQHIERDPRLLADVALRCAAETSEPSAGMGIATHFAIYDGVPDEGGHLLLHQEFAENVSLLDGCELHVAPIKITLE